MFIMYVCAESGLSVRLRLRRSARSEARGRVNARSRTRSDTLRDVALIGAVASSCSRGCVGDAEGVSGNCCTKRPSRDPARVSALSV